MARVFKLGFTSMLYWFISLLGLFIFCGCDLNSPSVIVPTKPLTEEQKAAIAKEDAETCNCGRVLASNIPNGQDGLVR